jgi:hypothetical protein
MKITRNLLVAALAAVATPALADGLDYTYLEGRYSSLDVDGEDGDGFGIRGSYAINDNLYILGQYGSADFDFLNTEATELRVGGGFHMPVQDGVDFVAELNWERTDVELDNPFPPFGRIEGDDNGVALSGGLRGMVTDKFELNGKVRYIDYGDVDDTVLGLGAKYGINDRWSVVGEYETGDTDAITLGVRLTF